MVDSSRRSTGTVPVNLVPLQGNCPSLFDLWTIYQFHSGQLAIAARVALHTVQAMLCNQPVDREEAQKVLEKLSALLRKEFTLETVYVALIEEETKEPYGSST
jgi:hypothetical protein